MVKGFLDMYLIRSLKTLDLPGTGWIESLSELKQVINLISSKLHCARGLCFALPFCWINDGETRRTFSLHLDGSARMPSLSSSSHLDCKRSRQFLLNCGVQTL